MKFISTTPEGDILNKSFETKGYERTINLMFSLGLTISDGGKVFMEIGYEKKEIGYFEW